MDGRLHKLNNDQRQDLFIRSIKLKEDMEGLDPYLSALPAVRNLHMLEMRKQVTFVVGENGKGKSTLLEAIAVSYGLNAEGGSKNFHFSSKATHSNLQNFITVVKGIRSPQDSFFLRAESFYNLATEVDDLDDLINYYGGKSLHEQSHGESFLSLVINRFHGHGIYILDEPEAALSPSRQLALLSRINQLVGLGSQFIIATHSPILMAYPDADIYTLDDYGIQLTPYQETEHYKLTKNFLDHPDQYFHYLFDT